MRTERFTFGSAMLPILVGVALVSCAAILGTVGPLTAAETEPQTALRLDSGLDHRFLPPFVLKQNAVSGFITSLRRAGDEAGVEFIRPGSALGSVTLRARTEDGAWGEADRSINGLEVRSEFRTEGDALRWQVIVKNAGRAAVEIGDLELPLPMNTDYVWDHEETFVRRVFRHAFIAGHGSFLYWLPVQGSGWFPVMMPEGDTGLEFFTAEGMDYAFGKERFSVFVHSTAAAEQTPRGTWRQPHTSRRLKPGEEACYAFGFHWTDSYDAVRAVLRQHGGVDVQVAPGLVVPRDLQAQFVLQSEHNVGRVEAEFPESTKIERLSERPVGASRLRVQFGRLGENRLIVH